MRPIISEHQSCANRPFETPKEDQSNHRRFCMLPGQLDHHDLCRFLSWLNSRGVALALDDFYGDFSARLQARCLVRTQLRALEGVERLAVPGSFECHYLRSSGHVNFLGSVPN